ncbi:MAG: acetyl-CoA synthetase [Candidatus Aenigmarchaeota archaeon ex4484_52]|nr:MAG: acetyl-CoA synthetase [Candidatus Aenigmarchaeota archaeon ex4484_52]
MKLTEFECYKFLKKYNIDIPKHNIATDIFLAKKYAKKIKYPVVMKIISNNILHKTEAKGVFTGVLNEKDLEEKYNKLLANADIFFKSKQNKHKPKIDGILIEEQKQGTEVIIGGKLDPQFGKTIMFGLGGIFVELLNDVSFRLVPLTKKDAFELINEIKAKKILGNFRNIKTNKQKLIDLILKISKMFECENIVEMDFNPVIVNEKEAVVCDARIVLDK